MSSATLSKSVRVLAVLGAVALFITGECQSTFVAVFAAFFVLGIPAGRFPKLVRGLSFVQPVLALLIFAVAVVDFFSLSKSFLLTVAHFLLALQGVRLLALETNREKLGSVLISSLMILSASTLSVDWTYFAMLFLFLLGVIWSLTLLTILDDSEKYKAHSADVLTERSWTWNQMMPWVKKGTLTGFGVAFCCCAFVFVLFPRFNFQGFRGQFLQPVHKTGFTSQVDLGGSGKIFEDESIIMRIELNPKDRDRWSGYVRGRTLDLFNGRTWHKIADKTQRVFRAGWRGDTTLPVSVMIGKETIRQKIYLESMDSPLLFAAPVATALRIDRPFLDIGLDGSIERVTRDAWRIHYEADSSVSMLTPGTSSLRPIKGAGQPRNRSGVNPQHLEVPDILQGPMREWLASVPMKKRLDKLGRARFLENYLRTRYIYSLFDKAPAKGQSALIQFLFDTKTGHCEYFASALCLSLRVQGIPARMVTGFLSKEWNARGHYIVVRSKHAHAWVEAYLEPYGWVGFDPSPRSMVDGDGATPWYARWAEMMDYMNLRWNRYVLSYDFEKQVSLIKGITEQSSDISARFGQLPQSFQRLFRWFKSDGLANAPSVSTSVPRVAGAVLFLLASFGALAVWAVKHVRENRTRVWFYPSLVRLLEKASGQKMADRTVHELFVLARSGLGERALIAGQLVDEYYRARFDPAFDTLHANPTHVKTLISKLSR